MMIGPRSEEPRAVNRLVGHVELAGRQRAAAVVGSWEELTLSSSHRPGLSFG